MKRYDTGGGWSTEAAHGKWVLYEDSRELVATLQAAHEMEAKDLKAEIAALKAELAALKAPPKVLSAQEVKETGAYWWCRPGVGNRVLVLVYRPDGCALRMRFFLNGSDLLLNGQFIGPIQMPEA